MSRLQILLLQVQHQEITDHFRIPAESFCKAHHQQSPTLLCLLEFAITLADSERQRGGSNHSGDAQKARGCHLIFPSTSMYGCYMYTTVANYILLRNMYLRFCPPSPLRARSALFHFLPLVIPHIHTYDTPNINYPSALLTSNVHVSTIPCEGHDDDFQKMKQRTRAI